MNLTQQKLTKEEWDFLEIPLDSKEMFILKYIKNNGPILQSKFAI